MRYELGCCIRNLAGLTVIIFILGLFSLLGFFLLGVNGEWLGLLFASLVVVLSLLLGDKLFLVLIGAKEVEERNSEVYKNLENLCCLNQLEEVRIYQSFSIPVNVLCVQPIMGSPSIIYSNTLINQNNIDLIRDTLKVCLPMIGRGAFRLSTMTSFVVALLMAPKFLFQKYRFEKLALVYNYFFAPISFLKDYVVLSVNKKMSERELETVEQIRFFLEKHPSKESSFSNELALDLCLVKKSNHSLWENLIYSPNPNFKEVLANERES